jgi:hypothetical protein
VLVNGDNDELAFAVKDRLELQCKPSENYNERDDETDKNPAQWLIQH